MLKNKFYFKESDIISTFPLQIVVYPSTVFHYLSSNMSRCIHVVVHTALIIVRVSLSLRDGRTPQFSPPSLSDFIWYEEHFIFLPICL